MVADLDVDTGTPVIGKVTDVAPSGTTIEAATVADALLLLSVIVTPPNPDGTLPLRVIVPVAVSPPSIADGLIVSVDGRSGVS